MSIFSTLSDALEEVREHLDDLSDLGAFVVKTKKEGLYAPAYVMPTLSSSKRDVMSDILNTGVGRDQELVAVFATIR